MVFWRRDMPCLMSDFYQVFLCYARNRIMRKGPYSRLAGRRHDAAHFHLSHHKARIAQTLSRFINVCILYTCSSFTVLTFRVR